MIYHLPREQALELSEKDRKAIEKAKPIQDKKEKQGKFYVLEGFKPTTEVFVPNGENVKKYLANYAKKLENKVTSLRKTKI